MKKKSRKAEQPKSVTCDRTCVSPRYWEEHDIVINLPRFPFFGLATVDNWFLTTVNPLVWRALNVTSLPISPEQLSRCTWFNRHGFSIDLYHWEHNLFDNEHIPLERRVRHRPDALLSIELMGEIFGLVTSGHAADLASARKVFEALLTRASSDGPTLTILRRTRGTAELGFSWSRPRPHRHTRDELTESLRRQEAVWSLVISRPESSLAELQREIARRRPKHAMSRTHVHRHRKLLDAFVAVLEKHPETLKIPHSKRNQLRRLAVQTLRAAIKWLANGRDCSIERPPRMNKQD